MVEGRNLRSPCEGLRLLGTWRGGLCVWGGGVGYSKRRGGEGGGICVWGGGEGGSAMFLIGKGLLVGDQRDEAWTVGKEKGVGETWGREIIP